MRHSGGARALPGGAAGRPVQAPGSACPDRWACGRGPRSGQALAMMRRRRLYDPKVVHPPMMQARRGAVGGIEEQNCTKIDHPPRTRVGALGQGRRIGAAERTSTRAVEMPVCGCLGMSLLG